VIRRTDVPVELRERAVLPGDPAYPSVRSTYTVRGEPALVLRPYDAAQVAQSLTWTRARGLPLAVRSGGHGNGSTNVGGVVVDLSGIDGVEVGEGRLVRLGPGARWAEVAARLAPHGLAISSGDHGGVGVGGLATAGGIGWLAREHGLTIDRVRGALVVLAAGTTTWTDAEYEPDLFWGVRGAGRLLGVVTELVVEAAPVTDVGHAELLVDLDRDGAALRRWSRTMSAAPRQLSSTMTIFSRGTRSTGRLEAVANTADPGEAQELLSRLADGLPVIDAQAQLTPYAALVPRSHLHENVAQQSGFHAATNGFVPTLGRDSAAAVMAAATSSPHTLLQVRTVGGAVNDVPVGATAFAHRTGELLVGVNVMKPGTDRDLANAWAHVAPYASGLYLNLAGDTGPAAYARAFPGATGERLGELRRRYDAEGVFALGS
jgi:FAD/FMN-containing dehydrogenase